MSEIREALKTAKGINRSLMQILEPDDVLISRLGSLISSLQALASSDEIRVSKEEWETLQEVFDLARQESRASVSQAAQEALSLMREIEERQK